jgi:NADPH-dependent F420 reductase
MKIGIIGTGNMGSGLGKLWAGQGHEVMFGSREPDRAKELAGSIAGNVRGGSYAEAAAFGDSVLLAVPWQGVEESVAACGSLADKILIDCTNPMTPDYMQLVVGHSTSGAEEIAKMASGAKVIKAFNHVYAQIIHSSPEFGNRKANVFIAGDDAEAKQSVANLIQDVGFEPVDSGPLQNARYLEPLAELCVQLAYALGMGTDQAMCLIQR